ncbi:MAG: hypothetical protein WHT46_03550 [Candidatus Geothermincolales bacterium]
MRFAHRSEQEFARLLDFYDIKWLYEPVSFDIAWDSKGNPVSKFTPDFYLPEFDLFIEITTMNQKLVTKKNRKIRMLRELYPEVKCKILYKRDFEGLLFKYNIDIRTEGEEETVADEEGGVPAGENFKSSAAPSSGNGGEEGGRQSEIPGSSGEDLGDIIG